MQMYILFSFFKFTKTFVKALIKTGQVQNKYYLEVENMDKKDKYFMYNIKCIFVTVINADNVKYSINKQL